MERFLGRLVMALCFCLFVAATGHAKQLKSVYLKDGGVIECQKFWKDNGKVMVLVNRDVLVDLSQSEVDMKRTFKAPKRTKVRKPAAPRTGPLSAAPPGNSKEGKGAPAGPAGARQEAMTSAAKPAAGTVTKPAGISKPPGPGAPAPVAAPAPAAAAKPVAAPVPKPAARPAPPVPAPPAGAAVAGMLGMGVLLPFLLIVFLLIASFWKVFTKAGEAGWQCLIPLYNMFVLVKISGKPWWWFLLMFVPVVNIIILILVQMALAERFERGPLFGLGLTFFGFIFYPVLAFGNAQYR